MGKAYIDFLQLYTLPEIPMYHQVIPLTRKTPRGGKRIAATNFTMSERVTAILMGGLQIQEDKGFLSSEDNHTLNSC